MDLQNFAGAFVFLALGVILAFVAAMIETWWKGKKKGDAVGEVIFLDFSKIIYCIVSNCKH